MAANGAGIFVQADRMVDFKRGLAKTREIWMEREMLDLFRDERKAPLFERLDGEEKADSSLQMPLFKIAIRLACSF